MLTNGAPPPVLVHCVAGSSRAGMACALFRLHVSGWTLERVLNEMEDFGFDPLKHPDVVEALNDELRIVRASNATAQK